MSYQPTEADYDVRLTERCRAWEAKNATKAAELRLVAQRRLGMTKDPTGSLTQLVLEREFREEVRKLHPKWPTLKQFLRGETP